jgi:hypothetical protein
MQSWTSTGYFSNSTGSFVMNCRFSPIIGWDPSVCKSDRLHVDILQHSFIKLGYILLKWLVIFLQSWTSTGYFSNSTGSFVTNCRFSPIIGLGFDGLLADTQLHLTERMWRNIEGGLVFVISKPLSVEVFGHNRLRSYCFQAQPATCSYLYVFLH